MCPPNREGSLIFSWHSIIDFYMLEWKNQMNLPNQYTFSMSIDYKYSFICPNRINTHICNSFCWPHMNTSVFFSIVLSMEFLFCANFISKFTIFSDFREILVLCPFSLRILCFYLLKLISWIVVGMLTPSTKVVGAQQTYSSLLLFHLLNPPLVVPI